MFLIQSSLLHKLEQWDQWLFIQINNHQSNSFFDSVLPYLRIAYFWTPLYLFLLVFIPTNFKSRGWWWCVFFLCTVSLCDMTSSQLVKVAFERWRPCADPNFFQYVRLLVDRCSGTYSFTSSHAANHFGMATFIFLTLRPVIGKWTWLAFLWAAIIGYAQVYVGVHYPFDVLAGGLLGCGLGYAVAVFFNNYAGLISLQNKRA